MENKRIAFFIFHFPFSVFHFSGFCHIINKITFFNAEIEETIKTAEPKVDMIFMETARQKDGNMPAPVPPHIG